jgi:hypothetical protein
MLFMMLLSPRAIVPWAAMFGHTHRTLHYGATGIDPDRAPMR